MSFYWKVLTGEILQEYTCSVTGDQMANEGFLLVVAKEC